jgi:hypothetical protein
MSVLPAELASEIRRWGLQLPDLTHPFLCSVLGTKQIEEFFIRINHKDSMAHSRGMRNRSVNVGQLKPKRDLCCLFSRIERVPGTLINR